MVLYEYDHQINIKPPTLSRSYGLRRDGRLIGKWSSASLLSYPLILIRAPILVDGSFPFRLSVFDGLWYGFWANIRILTHRFRQILRFCGSTRRRGQCFRRRRDRWHFWLSTRLLANILLWFCRLPSCRWTPRRRKWVRRTSHLTCKRSISISPIFSRRS